MTLPEYQLSDLLNLSQYPVDKLEFRNQCRRALDRDGVLVLADFLSPSAIESVQKEGDQNRSLAYYTANSHNIYLQESDPTFPPEHARNRQIQSSKGCITTDQIPGSSALHTLYDAPEFRSFLCAVLGEKALYKYADPMSSINLHYASEGQELGWHFDNSSFAITLMIQTPAGGGEFQYVKDVRDADNGEMNYTKASQVLDGEIPAQVLSMEAGALVLFRGRNSMHRVTPTIGDRTRMLVVLAYNTQPGISLSESARMTFYGRLG